MNRSLKNHDDHKKGFAFLSFLNRHRHNLLREQCRQCIRITDVNIYRLLCLSFPITSSAMNRPLRAVKKGPVYFIAAAKMVVPTVNLPAISIPALSTFSDVLSYWEDRTKFLMAGNLTTAIGTQQALNDPDREDRYIGLLSGDYLMVRKKDTSTLGTALSNLDLVQGYLVHKDADQNVPLETRAQSAVPGITYATMKVSVQVLDPSTIAKPKTPAKLKMSIP